MKKRFKPEVRSKQYDKKMQIIPLCTAGYSFTKIVWIMRPSAKRIAKLIDVIARRVKRKRPIKGHFWYPNYFKKHVQIHLLKRHLKKH